MEDVTLSNVGTLFGNASLGTALINDGQVETIAGERMRFAGANNVNRGEIHNFGGQVRFDQSLANESFIAGRGQFIAGDWMNEGVMAFSGGNADVIGDLINLTGGQIVTTGVGVTTFFDDVVHNGLEIRTSAGSNSVFLGEVSGSGPFTGTGTVYFEGDLRPGNSPAIVEFEGDLVLGTLAATFIEIGGLNLGEFDQLQVAGDMYLDGNFHVSLIDGFTLGFNQEFLIADVGGALSGTFFGLDEGDLVGTFGSHDLFISYSRGSSSGVSLFTAVPEPSTAGCVVFAALAVYWKRRRTSANSVPFWLYASR